MRTRTDYGVRLFKKNTYRTSQAICFLAIAISLLAQMSRIFYILVAN